MKSLFIVANWKSNKTKKETLLYLDILSKNLKRIDGKEVIICPSFVHLQLFSDYIKENNLDIKLGAQNVSHFEEGPFTGEVNAKQLRDFVSYCIVGHSERREKFSEDLGSINSKISNLINAQVTPILCISEVGQLEGVNDLENCIIAYEPLGTIGTGKALDPSLISSILGKLRQTTSLGVLYGGSVDPHNVSKYSSSFDGVLMGT